MNRFILYKSLSILQFHFINLILFVPPYIMAVYKRRDRRCLAIFLSKMQQKMVSKDAKKPVDLRTTKDLKNGGQEDK